MNYKARYNRIRDRVSSMSVQDRTDLISGTSGPITGRGAFSCSVISPADQGIIKEEEAAVRFPSAAMIGCSFDESVAEKVSASVGEQQRLRGVQMVIGPSAAVMRSPLDGRNSERFSEEPFLTGKMAAACLRGLRSKGVEGCLTEFGCSHSEQGLYTSDSAVDLSTLGELYMESFRIAVSEGEASAMMLSPGRINGRRTWLDAQTLDMLRRMAGFDGTVLAAPGVCGDVQQMLSAGIDLIPGLTSKEKKELALSAQKDQETAAAMEGAAMRNSVLLDCFRELPVVIPPKKDRSSSAARSAARDCMVLLKNRDGMLPLGKGRKIAVIGSAAERKPGSVTGMFSRREPSGTSLLEGLSDCGCKYIYARGYNPDGSTNPELIKEARDALKEAGIGIFAAGLPDGAESEGYDRKDMRLPDGILRLADLLITDGIPMACVIMTASAVELPFEYGMDAVLFAGHCGDATGAAAADILTGRAEPSGRLSFSWPKRAGMITPAHTHIYSEGVATGHRAAESGRDFEGYPFGYGLSFSEVEFLGARIDKRVIIGEHQKVDILYRIRNSGESIASFVPQVYLRRGSSRLRKLIAFRKVFVLPGQIKNEHIEVDASEFKLYDPARQEKLFCAGQYTVELATACSDSSVLQEFELSVFPKDWNSVAPVEERTGEADAAIRQALSTDDRDPVRKDRDEIIFRDADRTMSGRALNAELDQVFSACERPFSQEWEESIRNMPVNSFMKLCPDILDARTAARAVRSASRKLSGSRWFGS